MLNIYIFIFFNKQYYSFKIYFNFKYLIFFIQLFYLHFSCLFNFLELNSDTVLIKFKYKLLFKYI